MFSFRLLAYPACVLLALQTLSAQSIPENQCDSTNEALSAKFRFLGEWDEAGRADYLESESDTVPQSLLDYIENTLPESISIIEANTGLFDPTAQLNTVLTDTADVFITYVEEGAGFNNTMGYYTYPKGSPPSTVYDLDSLVIIFPNVDEEGVVEAGQKVKIGRFPPNTVIGYFLIPDGWVEDTICLHNYMVFTDRQLNIHTSSEYRQHTILVQNQLSQKILLGFEDLPRPSSDDDFNDVMFWVDADPFAIDTTDIITIPTATIDGDTVLCNPDDPAQVRIDLTGGGPWDVVYFDGTEDVSIEGIIASPYFFETTVKDTITLKSVINARGAGTVEGDAIIRLDLISAEMADQGYVCEGEELGKIRVDLTGIGPWTLSYTDGGQTYEESGITENPYYIEGIKGPEYTLLDVSDAYCIGEASGTATIETKAPPTAILESTTAVCDDDFIAELELSLTGEAPFTVTIEKDGVESSYTVEEGASSVMVSEPGAYTLVSVEDPYCAGTASGSVEVDVPPYPTVEVSDNAVVCEGSTARAQLTFTGVAPWTFTYTMGGETFTETTTDPVYMLDLDAPGVYTLTSIEDEFCTGSVEGSATLEVKPRPTAVLSGGGIICENETAALDVALTGSGPWNIVYTNGSTDFTSTASAPDHTITVSEAGTYTLLQVSDAFCEGMGEGTATLEEKASPTAVISGGGAICPGDETAEISIELTGSAPWTVTYTDGTTETTIETNESPYAFNAEAAGQFEIISVADMYCSGTGSGMAEVIDELEALDADILADDLVCYGDPIALSISGVQEVYIDSFTASGEGSLTQEGPFDYTYTPAEDESGVIAFTLELSNTCGSKTISREVLIQDAIDASFDVSPVEIFTDTPVDFVPVDDSFDFYEWEFGDGNASALPSPVHEYSESGTYTVSLLVDKNGCTGEASADLEVFANKLLFVPNAFNPTAINPENRVVKVYGTGVSRQEFYFRIVNRWGKTLYETTDWDEANLSGWDGLNTNVDEQQELNVFTYILRGKFEDNERFEETGTVTLVK